ncbi:hypothetical protein D0838_05100 [Bordetella avium]|nr:hypothetical protein D0838_05100 [Bordetella avium]
MAAARRRYWQPPPADEYAWLGLTLQDIAPPPVALLPDNRLPFAVFAAMDTQWRTGPGGATGLDYGVLPTVLRFMNVERTQWPGVWDSVRVMERAALEEMHKD